MVSLQRYRQIVRDRPVKLTGDDVGFEKSARDRQRCGGCWHWAIIPNQDRNTCEIFRPDPEISVPANATCRFFTVDGEHFPKLREKDGKVD